MVFYQHNSENCDKEIALFQESKTLISYFSIKFIAISNHL